MAEFEVIESNFINGKSIQGKVGLTIEILNEITNQQTAFGLKPKGSVKLIEQNGATQEKEMQFNQTFINYLVGKFGADSKNWIGTKTPIKVETIKGNLAIVPKEGDN